jgi:anti-sigma B factor antagonist
MGGETLFSVVLRDGIPVIRITGDLDHYSLPGFRSAISDLITNGHINIVVDMSGVEFMDSGGMSGIVFALKRLSPLGGHLRLANASPRIIRKLDIGGLTKISDVLTVSDTVEKAIEDLPAV